MQVRERISLVGDFQRILGQPVNSEPAAPAAEDVQERVKHLFEEMLELVCALGMDVAVHAGSDGKPSLDFCFARDPDFPETVDALRDIEYILYSLENTLGVQDVSDETFMEVHRANMRKFEVSQPDRHNAVKPDGWRPPDIAGILRRRFPKRAMLFR